MSSPRPALSRGTVDRRTPDRADEAGLDAAWPGARLLRITPDGQTAIRMGGLTFDATSGPRPADAFYLGRDGDGDYFATVSEEAQRGRMADLREVGADLDDRDAGLFVHAVALAHWHRLHTHCPQCGTATIVTKGGAERECPRDGSHHFPRTDPAMIVIVTDEADTRALLGRQPTWPAGRFSTLAGFVEPGESAEQCVIREVAEETGVTCWRPTYVDSQPWPFPASLMLGFHAFADPDATITVPDGELESARWFTREEILDGSALLPGPVSIAYRLIMGWARPASPTG